jgi:hypothetical protein
LKSEHSLATNSAWWIAERAEGKATVDDDPEAYLNAAEQYVEKMYSGKKGRPAADLRRVALCHPEERNDEGSSPRLEAISWKDEGRSFRRNEDRSFASLRMTNGVRAGDGSDDTSFG